MGALHLALHARLDVAVHVELFDFEIKHVADAGQAFGGIEQLEDFLLFFDRELQIGGDGVGELGRVFHLDRRNHGFVIQRLAKLHVLLKERRNALHRGFNLWAGLVREPRHPHRRLHKAFSIDHLQDLAALNAFD